MKVLVLFILVLLNTAQAKDYPLAVFPPGAEIVDTGGYQVVNGMPLQLKVFRLQESLHWVKNWYLKQWREEVVETEFEGWLQLGRYFGTVMYTVQLKQSGPWVDGRLAISDFSQEIPSSPELPEESLLLTDVVQADEHTQGRMYAFQSVLRAPAIERWSARHFEQKGMRLLERRFEPVTNAVLLRYGRGARNAAVVILEAEGSSQVMVTETRGVNL